MKPFMNEDFLLHTNTAKVLYHEHAAKMPIIDYHCHINAADIADDKKYDTVTEVWLGGDHYKWRAMRSNGVPESYITGDADPMEKFQKWADTMPKLIGNPLYHWTHLELQRYFGIFEPLCPGNAKEIFEECNRILAQPDMSVRGMIDRSNVKLLCTTDDPVDKLSAHDRIAADKACRLRVLPAFRPDKAMNIDKPGFAEYIKKLEAVCGFPIDRMDKLRTALANRIEYFAQRGCLVSDHGLESCFYTEADDSVLDSILKKARQGEPLSWEETEQFKTAVLVAVAKEYKKRNWVMQLHFGCIRNNSDVMFKKLGPDTGYDAINDVPNAGKLAALLNGLEKNDALPKTVLYSLNPADNYIICTVMGSFQTDSGSLGRIQAGSAWWFEDHKLGMEKQMQDLASLGVLGNFIGMLTDSRSFLSYTRHEYFRRILCGLIGTWVENGEYPNDKQTLGKMVEDISYNNTLNYFGFKL